MPPGTRVSALYRHPVKSFSPERVERLDLTSDGRIEGDRVLAFRFANAGAPGDLEWRSKNNYIALVNTPGLGRLRLKFDSETRMLCVDAGDAKITAGSVDDETERVEIALAVTDFVLKLDENPLDGHPARQPLLLVGDGRRGLFHDTKAGLVTLHSAASVQALGEAMGDENLDGARFRSNIVIDGTEPFAELTWPGKNIQIGETRFKVIKPVTRCLTTHANPRTGVRDLPVMDTLVRHFGQDAPQFAVQLRAIEPAGKVIRAGDRLELI